MPGVRYRDPYLSPAERADNLLGLMTAEEKLSQLQGAFGWQFYRREGSYVSLTETARAQLAQPGLGGLYGLLRADPWTGVTAKTGLSPSEGAELVNEIQKFAVENTRLGIPLFIIAEANHGYMALGGTLAPSVLMASCAFDPELWQEMMSCAAREMRAQGNNVAFCPNVDLARDPRWGRTEETAGEDPFLAAGYAKAAVQGLQGASLNSDHSVAACLKHFVHGTPTGGLNAADAHFGSHDLYELYLRPFRAGIESGAAGIMPAYNEIDGVPCSGSRQLLDDLLRGRLGFKGVTFSDVGALGMLVSPYRVCATKAEAAAKAILAGVDFETSQTRLYGDPLLKALDSGLVDEATLDRSVLRILRLKFELGLFDRPFADPDLAEAVVGSREHADVSRQVAREGIVLLKNESNLLPLSKGLRKIAVLGPNADNVYNQLGDYTAPQRPGETITILNGIREAVSPQTKVVHACGCAIRGEEPREIERAVALARDSEVAIVVVGGSSARDFDLEGLNLPEQGAMTAERTSKDIECGEGLDRATLDLLGKQLDFVQAIHATGTPTVVVLAGGRPLTIEWIREHIGAIVVAWYPGQQGGHALAEILFGDHAPSGKLSISWPKHVGQLPVCYNRKPIAASGYVEMDKEPAFTFGHGLGYVPLVYTGLDVPTSVKPGNAIRFRVRIRNDSGDTREEVVLVFIKDLVSSVTRPEKELKAYRRIRMEPFEERSIEFELSAEDVGFYDASGMFRVEPGWFEITVGDLRAEFELLPLGSSSCSSE